MDDGAPSNHSKHQVWEIMGLCRPKMPSEWSRRCDVQTTLKRGRRRSRLWEEQCEGRLRGRGDSRDDNKDGLDLGIQNKRWALEGQGTDREGRAK